MHACMLFVYIPEILSNFIAAQMQGIDAGLYRKENSSMYQWCPEQLLLIHHLGHKHVSEICCFPF